MREKFFRYAKICDAWSSLKNAHIKNARVIIENMGDIHPFFRGPVFDAHTVYLRHCDKNFVFYWLDEQTFPWARKIYLASHPCEPEVLRRFPQSTIILSDRFEKFKFRWAQKRESVLVMPFEEMDKIFAEDRIEPLVVEEFSKPFVGS